MSQLFLEKEASPRPHDSVRIAIVGGGAGGALTAVHLLRGAVAKPLEIVILDAAGSFGPGVAYGTDDPLHLLNVPAVRMGGIASHPDHFHRWLQTRGCDVDPAEFLPRSLYGEYLEAQLERAAAIADPATRVELRTAEVRKITAAEPDEGLTLTLADGERLAADHVVLAIGPLPGADPVPVPAELFDSGRYVADPWRPGALDSAREAHTVLILGTGLTMVDVALTLAAARPEPRLLAVSRHGFVPRRHRRELTEIERFPIPTDEGTLEQVAGAVLERVVAVTQEGGDWRDVIDSARPAIPTVWRNLDLAEKRRFLTRFQRLWDVHRFRVAPAGADRLAALRRGGRLRIAARGVARLEAIRGGVRAWLDGGDAGLGPVEVDMVVNCCGAATDVRSASPPLLTSMFADGLARPDALGLGLDVGPGGALLDAGGAVGQPIHVVGALRRGVEWEAISVSEIREHADLAARAILAKPNVRTLSQ